MERNWFDELERRGVKTTPEQRRKIEEKINAVLTYEPRIGVFGKTGAGKSSLCNALFGQDVCPISDVAACTRNPQEVLLNMGGNGIKLVDVPGTGESTERDKEYAELYTQLLPELDLVLWLIKADDRAMGNDETFYQNIVIPHIEQGKPFFMVLNQVDKIEPWREWNDSTHEPGPRQFQNVHGKIETVANQFNLPASKIIPVSANEKYNLTKLVDEIIFALPKEKNITLFRAVDKEFQSVAAGEHVKKGFLEIVADTITTVVDRVADTVETVVETVRDVKDWIDDHLLWWWPF